MGEIVKEIKDEEVIDITDPIEPDEEEDINYNYRMENYKAMLEKRRAEKEKISAEVAAKYPGVRMFSITLPYNGTYVIKAQEMHDMKYITTEVEKFVEEKIAGHGGRAAIEAMDQQSKEKIYRDIDATAADYSNDLLLRRCVLYPYNISEMLDTEEPGKGLPVGAGSLLLERLVDISGWQDVLVEEI